jgi:hypothetical protein
MEDELMAIRKSTFKNFMANKFIISQKYNINVDNFIEDYEEHLNQMMNDEIEKAGDKKAAEAMNDFIVED